MGVEYQLTLMFIQFTWVFVILGNSYDIKLGVWRADAESLLSVQEFWFAIFMTVLYVTSWDVVSPQPASSN